MDLFFKPMIVNNKENTRVINAMNFCIYCYDNIMIDLLETGCWTQLGWIDS